MFDEVALRTDAAVLNSARLFLACVCGGDDLTISCAVSGLLDFLQLRSGASTTTCWLIEIGLAPSGGNSQVLGTLGGGPPRAGNSSVSNLKSFFLMTIGFGAFLDADSFELIGWMLSSISS